MLIATFDATENEAPGLIDIVMGLPTIAFYSRNNTQGVVYDSEETEYYDFKVYLEKNSEALKEKRKIVTEPKKDEL